MVKVINAVINQLEFLKEKVNRLEYVTETYHEYKKEKEDFVKYLREKIEKSDEDGAIDSVRDKEQQEISKST